MNYKETLEEVKDQLINAGDYDDVYWDCVPTVILSVCAEALILVKEKELLKKKIVKTGEQIKKQKEIYGRVRENTINIFQADVKKYYKICTILKLIGLRKLI